MLAGVWGEVGGSSDNSSSSSMMMLAKVSRSELSDGDNLISNFWNLEAIGITDSESANSAIVEDPAEHYFESTVQFENGRYQVKLPWKVDHPELPTNEDLAVARLKILLRRLKGSPDLLRQYQAHLQDHMERDFVEAVPADELEGQPGATHYLTHHPVVRSDKVSTKIRSVFDASSGKPSLNYCLESGPNQIQSLFNILLRFRRHKIALTADVEKAFLQIRLAKEDRNLVRFVWVDDPFAPEPQIVHYRWKSVVFGVTTSPFLLTATIRHHTMKYSESHPDTEGSLLNDMYMDDFILGAQNEGTARKLAEEATSILKDAGLPLRR